MVLVTQVLIAISVLLFSALHFQPVNYLTQLPLHPLARLWNRSVPATRSPSQAQSSALPNAFLSPTP